MTSSVVVDLVTADAKPTAFEACARIHREELHEGFLSTLGDRFLTILYRTLAGSPHAFLLVARAEGAVVGFICGSLDVGKVYRDFARRAGPAIFPVLLPQMLSPRRIARIIETLIYPNRRTGPDLPKPEILNFCVTATAQGTGIGRTLFGALGTEFRRRGVHRIRIVTGANQRSAQAFYERAGARLAGRIEVHRGSPELAYVYDIPAPQDGGAVAHSSIESREMSQ